MNRRKTLEVLNKLANELDEIGRQKEANYIDLMISKLANTLTPIGKPYKVGDRYFQKFDAGNQGTVTKEVNFDGSPKEEIPVTQPADKMKDAKPTDDETWEAWFRRMFPGVLPGLQSDSEGVLKEKQQNPAKDKSDVSSNKVEKLLQEIQERYNKLRGLGWTPPKEEILEPTEIMSFDPDEVATRMDIIDNINFDSLPESDATGESDWADISMWQDGNPLDNRF